MYPYVSIFDLSQAGGDSKPKGKKKSALSGIMILDPARASVDAREGMDARDKGVDGSSDNEWEDCPSLLVGRSSAQNERITFQVSR